MGNLFDRFTYSAGALAGQTSDSGDLWGPSSAGNVDADGTGYAYATSSTTSFSFCAVSAWTPPGADYDVKIVQGPDYSQGWATVGARLSTVSSLQNGYFYLFINNTVPSAQFFRYVSGTATALGSPITLPVPAPGTTFVLRVQGSNPVVLTALVDGVSIATFSDSDPAKITAAGLAGFGTSDNTLSAPRQIATIWAGAISGPVATITPSTPSVVLGATQGFTAATLEANEVVNWICSAGSCSPTTGATTTWTAPGSGSSATVTWTSADLPDHTATATVTLTGTPRGAATFYIDSASGSDSNNGTSSSTPWQTLAPFVSARFVSGDGGLYLKAGSTIQGPIVLSSVVGSESAPYIVSTYGGSTQVTIRTGNTDDTRASSTSGNGRGIHIVNPSYVEVFGNIKVLGPGVDINAGTTTSDGTVGHAVHIESTTTTGTPYSGLVISGLEMTGTYDGIWVESHATGSTPDGLAAPRFIGLNIHDCLNLGILVWGGDTTTKSGLSWYAGQVHTDVEITACELYNIPGDPNLSGEPITLINCTRGLIDGCVVHDSGGLCALNFGGTSGAGGIVLGKCVGTTIARSEVYNMTTPIGHSDGVGFDTDDGCVDCSIVNCYSHDNWGPGYQIVSVDAAHLTTGTTIKGCVSINDCRNPHIVGASSTWVQGAIALFSAQRATVINNTIVLPQATTAAPPPACITTWDNIASASDNHALIANNILSAQGTSLLISSPATRQANAIYHGNLYFSTGTPTWTVANGTSYTSLAAFRGAGYETLGGSSVGNYADPLLSGASLHPVELPTSPASAYAGACPGGGSPAIGGGLSFVALGIAAPPTTDFQGKPITSPPPVGACNNTSSGGGAVFNPIGSGFIRGI